MTDHREKVRYYRDRSEECSRMADLSPPAIAAHYRRMAECYLELAEIEERLANGGRRSSEPGASEPHP